MPCSDVTECISVVVGPGDLLADYQFQKRTCGQGVGAGRLLEEILLGRTVDDVLDYDAERFLSEHPVDGGLEEFLMLKHLFAVQSALEVLTGKEPGSAGDPCAAAAITYEPSGEIIISAQIAVDLMTEKIKSCGGCKGCGKSKKPVFH